MSSEKSSKPPVMAPSGVPVAPTVLELVVGWVTLSLIFLTYISAGLRRGYELMPWPDGLEYAASAVNLADGRGAVLHFGGYTYPSRYTGGYPLILEFFYRFNGVHAPLFLSSTLLAILSVFFVLYLTRFLFGNAASIDCGGAAWTVSHLHYVFVARDERCAHIVRDASRCAGVGSGNLG